MFKLERFVGLLGNPVIVRRTLATFLMLGAIMSVWVAVNDSRETTAVRQGDFPAFWSLAVIAAGPEPHRLYDVELQRAVQNAAWPALAGSALPAAYPPYVAYVLQPLAHLDHMVARQIWTGVSLVASFVAVLLLVRLNPSLPWAPWMVWTALFLFSPTLRGIAGGQLMSIIALLMALCFTFERRRSWMADVLLGAALGVLLCKPYYALCALAIPILQRRWLAILCFSAVALGWMQCAVAVLGDDWFIEWTTFARRFAQINLETNSHQMPNLWAQLYSIYGGTQNFGLVGWGLAVASYAALALGVFYVIGPTAVRKLLKAPRQYGDLLLCLVLSLVVILMPQVNFYDLGVVACAVISLFRPGSLFDRVTVIACIVISQFAVSPPFGLPVHFVLALIGLGYVCVHVRERALQGVS
jgi:hypothetical protein